APDVAADVARTTTTATPRLDPVAPDVATRYGFAPLGEPRPDDVDPLRWAPYAAIFEGVWSAALTIGWAVSARSYDAPYPDGLVGLLTARVLYGTTWSLALGLDVAIARLVAGEDGGGLALGRFSDTWLVGLRVPGHDGAGGTIEGVCGGGLGSFSEVSAVVGRAGPVSLRAAMLGGWIMGRFLEDDLATRAESTWMLSPITVLAEVPIDAGPLRLDLSLGPGLFGGLHNAHVHPKGRTRAELDVPWTELVVLHGGVGPGVHARATLTFWEIASLDAEAELAWLALGGTNEDLPEVLDVLDALRYTGTPTWRKLTAGVGLALPALAPLRFTARVWLGQLSPGPITALGHQGLGLELTIPIELTGDAAADPP
ncbi:hypothetical protein L6R52_27845, partial [Myxococcota bacterium]|nr:hypothetical protein [Myxococcota bacterium]